jgi:hypothetical protein
MTPGDARREALRRRRAAYLALGTFTAKSRRTIRRWRLDNPYSSPGAWRILLAEAKLTREEQAYGRKRCAALRAARKSAERAKPKRYPGKIA